MDLALQSLPRQDSIPGVLVGYHNADDAGVFLIAPDLALVQTVDYFPPIVDDPYTYGQITAVNALSDVYAMGGRPITALSMVGFPAKSLDFSILGRIMAGGVEKLNEAGVALLGGHSIKDDEIKFGYSVTGLIDPKQVKENRGGRVGDHLLLTKALGTGLITTALKNKSADPEHVASAVDSMIQLNRVASEAAVRFGAHTMTDITGYGLIGHALEVARASSLEIEIDHRALPVLPGALEYSRRGFCAGGLSANREFFVSRTEIGRDVPAEFQDLIFDPQTSGGLLIFCGREVAGELLENLRSAGVRAVEIGRAVAPGAGKVLVD